MKTSNSIRAARIRSQMPLKASAAIVGIAPATLHRFEFGNIALIPAATIQKLASAYHEPPHKLLNWQGDSFFLPDSLNFYHLIEKPESPSPYQYLLCYHMHLSSYALVTLMEQYPQLDKQEQYLISMLICSFLDKKKV